MHRHCIYMDPGAQSLIHVWLFATPWTVAHQAPWSMESSRQEYWSGLPFPSPGDLPNPGMEPGSPALQADSLPSEPQGKPCETLAVFPALHRISWKLADFIHSSWRLLVPFLSLAPPPCFSPLLTPGVFSVSVSLLLFSYIHFFVLYFLIPYIHGSI